ncbi:MAG: family 16 glycosylhydrolase [Verrucomicrobia bacterium]|nr:MAG: family 16 glycosylhydrolase [Verrucomicrobiota bacterium]
MAQRWQRKAGERVMGYNCTCGGGSYRVRSAVIELADIEKQTKGHSEEDRKGLVAYLLHGPSSSPSGQDDEEVGRRRWAQTLAVGGAMPRPDAHLTCVFLLVCVCCTAILCADTPPGGKWKPIPELTDEFDGGKLDATKWQDHNPGWKGRKPGFFSTTNVGVSDGKLHLTARAENLKDPPQGYHTFTTAAVKSKALVKYGYFEIKCRPMKSKASSGFWFYSKTQEAWTEIDVFEICGVGEKWRNTYNMNAHVFFTPTETHHWSKGDTWKAPFDFVDDYHIYGLEWDQAVIKWWVDGKVVRELKNTHWHEPLNMNFDSETMPEWFGLPDKESLPSTFSIEYVRSWRHTEDGEPDGPAN